MHGKYFCSICHVGGAEPEDEGDEAETEQTREEFHSDTESGQSDWSDRETTPSKKRGKGKGKKKSRATETKYVGGLS